MLAPSAAVEHEDKTGCLNQESKAEPMGKWTDQKAVMILQEDRNGHNQLLGDEGDWPLPNGKEGA